VGPGAAIAVAEAAAGVLAVTTPASPTVASLSGFAAVAAVSVAVAAAGAATSNAAAVGAVAILMGDTRHHSFRMRVCGMRMRAFRSIATEVFGYAAICGTVLKRLSRAISEAEPRPVTLPVS
jgi:hypothetical protein